MDHGFGDYADNPLASYEAHPVEEMEPAPIPDSEQYGHALSVIFRWLAEPHLRPCLAAGSARGGEYRVNEYINPRKLGMRTAAMIYSLRPDLFPGETAVSLSKKVGVTKQAFAKHVRAFRVAFALQTRVMRSPAAREAMRQAATKWHREQKEKTAAAESAESGIAVASHKKRREIK